MRASGFPEFFVVSVGEVGGGHLVSLQGELDMASADRLEELLADIAGSTVVVELAELDFIDSSGIGALIRAKRRIEETGNAMRVRGPLRSEVALALGAMGLSSWVDE